MKKTNNQNKPRQMSGDERIRNRSNQRKKKIRRKKIIFRSVLAFIFLLTGIVLSLVMFFDIKEIAVTGDEVYSSGDIVNASEVSVGDNLIFISKNKTAELISTKLPYVGSVTVKRRLPSKLELVITKTEARYAVFADGYYTLLDENAKVLEKDVEYIGDNIVMLNLGDILSAEPGKTLSPAEAKLLDKLFLLEKAIEESGFEGATALDLSDIYNIKLVYQGRITLELGDTNKSNLSKKLDFGKAAIEKQNEESELYRGTINLTVDGKGYWSEETVTEVPTEIESETEAPTENSAESIVNSE